MCVCVRARARMFVSNDFMVCLPDISFKCLSRVLKTFVEHFEHSYSLSDLCLINIVFLVLIFLCFNLFSASFCTTLLSAGIVTSVERNFSPTPLFCF